MGEMHFCYKKRVYLFCANNYYFLKEDKKEWLHILTHKPIIIIGFDNVNKNFNFTKKKITNKKVAFSIDRQTVGNTKSTVNGRIIVKKGFRVQITIVHKREKIPKAKRSCFIENKK